MIKVTDLQEEELEGYKVLLSYKDLEYHSLTRPLTFGCVKYVVNEWTYPATKCGKLSVFTSIAAVTIYLQGVTHHPVYDLEIVTFACLYVRCEKEESLWAEDRNGNKAIENWRDFPYGTDIASKVMLLDKVNVKSLVST